MIGHRAYRPLIGLENVDLDVRFVGEKCASPSPWPERAYRRQSEKPRLQRQNWAANRQIVCRAACGRGDEHTIAKKLAEPLLTIHRNGQARGLRRLPEQVNFV